MSQRYPEEMFRAGAVIGGASAMNIAQQPRPESQMSIALNETEAAAGALLSMIDSIGTTLRDALAPAVPENGAEGSAQNIQRAPSEMRGRIEHVTATINVGIERLRNLRDRLEI